MNLTYRFRWVLPLGLTLLYFSVVKQWLAVPLYFAVAIAMAFYFFPLVGLFMVRRDVACQTSKEKFVHLFTNLFYCLIIAMSVVYLYYPENEAVRIALALFVIVNFLVTIMYFKLRKNTEAYYSQLGFFVFTSAMAVI